MKTTPSERTRAQIFADLAAPRDAWYRRDPVLWAREVAGLELWSKQREIIESVRDNKQTCVKSCHQVGKSLTAATVVSWWLATHTPGTAFAVTTAPTFAQVRSILWREIGAIHSRALLPGKTNQTEWHINNKLVAFGRKPSDHNQHGMQGLHAQHMLVVIDEGCGVNKMMYDAAMTLIADEGGKILVIGNPDTSDGEFFRIFQPDSGWHQISVSAFDSPNFTGEEVPEIVRKSLIHPNWVADRAVHWGEESALYQSKCLGEFPTIGDPWQVVPLPWATACRYLEFPTGKKPIEAGVDVGAGNDRTVITVREGDRIKTIEWFVDPDPVKTVPRIARVLAEHEVTCVKVDSIGVGWGIYGSLRDLSRINNPQGSYTTHSADVVPINVALSPTAGNEDKYLNRRAEMWFEIGRERSRTQRWDFSGLSMALQDELVHELTMPKYEIMDGKGKVKIEAKDKIRERLGASPDIAESALLAFVPASWAADISGGFIVTQMPAFDLTPIDSDRRPW